MKKLNVSLLSTVVASLLLQTSLASAATRYIWSSTDGLKKAGNCQATSQDQIPFFAVQKAGKLQDGILSSNQIDGIAKSSLKEISDSIIEFKDKTLNDEIAGQKLSNTFLQAAFDGDDYAALLCKNGSSRKGYVVFNVFTAGQEDAIAQIAINKNDAKILNSTRVHSVEEATKIMVERLNENTQSVGVMTMNGRSSSVTPSSAVSPKLEHGAVVTPAQALEAGAATDQNDLEETVSHKTEPVLTKTTQVTESAPAEAAVAAASESKNYVICSPTADLRVRDQSLRKVLFSAKRMAKIKLLQDLGSGKSYEVSGVRYSFVKVEFLDSKKSGFVADKMVKVAEQCGGQSVAVTAQTTSKTSTTAADREKSKPVVTTDGNVNILAESCASRTILSAAKTDVRISWGNRANGRGLCALGVRKSLQRSKVGGIQGGIGNAIDFVARLKSYGYVDTGIRDIAKAPAGAVLIFGGPYTAQYLRNGVMRKPYGNYVGHVTIKGDDGFYYTDGRTKDPAIGWRGTRNVAGRRNLAAVMMPGSALVNSFANRCN